MSGVRRFAQCGLWFGGALVFVAALLIGVDVLMRKFLARSIGGADELAGYALALGTAWSLGAALLERAHIRIDSLYVLLARPGVPARMSERSDALRSNCVFPISLGLFAGERARRTVDAVMRYLVEHIADYDVVMPDIHGEMQPLHAIYSKACLPPMRHCLEANRLRIVGFLPEVRVCTVTANDLQPLDPDLLAFQNLNTPEEFQAAAQRLQP